MREAGAELSFPRGSAKTQAYKKTTTMPRSYKEMIVLWKEEFSGEIKKEIGYFGRCKPLTGAERPSGRSTVKGTATSRDLVARMHRSFLVSPLFWVSLKATPTRRVLDNNKYRASWGEKETSSTDRTPLFPSLGTEQTQTSRCVGLPQTRALALPALAGRTSSGETVRLGSHHSSLDR